jgi:hypothetical protein
VPLLGAYEGACHSGDPRKRLELADAICQGISPDPELFLNHVALLGAYSMIEHLVITTDAEGQAAYTPLGRRHVQLFEEYAARIGRVSKALHDDCPHFRPVAGAYSPYGVMYGFSSDLVEHMAFKTLQADAVTRFSLEDVFAGGDADTLAWVSGWRKLPHLTQEVIRQFDYPQQFAEDVFDRIEQALRRCASDDEANSVQIGRLVIVPEDGSHTAVAYDEAQLLKDRREGRCLLSYRTPDGWMAISKDVLTEVLGTGRDMKVVGLPRVAAEALKLMCPQPKTGA